MRLIIALLAFSSVALMLPHIASAIPPPISALLVFPREGMEVPPDSHIILAFAYLVDPRSVGSSLVLTLEPSISVSLEPEGECGDGSILTFSPSGGNGLQPGNYTLSFGRNMLTIDQAGILPPQNITFRVSSSASLEVSGVSLDSLGTSTTVEFGSEITTMAGSIDLTLGFSSEIDLGKLVDMLRNSGLGEKPSNCQSRAITLSVSLTGARTVTFTMNSASVIDRSNQSRTLSQSRTVTIRGTGPPVIQIDIPTLGVGMAVGAGVGVPAGFLVGRRRKDAQAMPNGRD